MTITPPARIEALILAKIASGADPGAGAVVEEAPRLLHARDDAESERIRAALQIGVDQIERGAVSELTQARDDRIWENARRKLREGRQPKTDVIPWLVAGHPLG